MQNAKNSRQRKKKRQLMKIVHSGISASWSKKLTLTVYTERSLIRVVDFSIKGLVRALRSLDGSLLGTWMPISMKSSRASTIMWVKLSSMETLIVVTLQLGLRLRTKLRPAEWNGIKTFVYNCMTQLPIKSMQASQDLWSERVMCPEAWEILSEADENLLRLKDYS